MAIGPETLRALLAAHVSPAVAAMRLSLATPEGHEQRFMARGERGALDIHL